MRITALKASALLALALALSAIAIAQAHAQAPAWAPADEAQRAQRIVEVAERALFKVESFISSIEQNGSLMSRLEESNLADDLRGNASLLEQARALLTEAKEGLEAGNYTEATMKAIEAMRICREVCKNVHEVLEVAGFEPKAERPEVRAQGILVAVNRSLERIERLEALVQRLDRALPLIEDVEDKLEEAKSLLDVEYIKQLLAAGNVSEAAKRLARANELIGQAYGLLHSVAKAEVAKRVERFRERIMERFNEVAKNMSQEELRKAMEELGFANASEFKKLLEEMVRQARESVNVKIDEALQRLKEVSDRLKGFTKIYVAKRASPATEVPALSINVEVSKERLWVIVKVKVKNVGNATILFPNTACGLVIEKEVDREWTPYYTPISAQLIVKLRPGEERDFSVRLFRPEPGHYRAVVRGFSEVAMVPASAYAEFTIR